MFMTAVMASSQTSTGTLPKIAANITEQYSFGTKNFANGWLYYDFKDFLIQPNHYSIRSWNNQWSPGIELVSWVIEISNDSSAWKEIDRHNNDQTFLQGAVGSFAVSKPCGRSRSVQLRQTGKTADGTFDHLVIASFELFGHLSKAQE
jgi:hypothetical protein